MIGESRLVNHTSTSVSSPSPRRFDNLIDRNISVLAANVSTAISAVGGSSEQIGAWKKGVAVLDRLTGIPERFFNSNHSRRIERLAESILSHCDDPDDRLWLQRAEEVLDEFYLIHSHLLLDKLERADLSDSTKNLLLNNLKEQIDSVRPSAAGRGSDHTLAIDDLFRPKHRSQDKIEKMQTLLPALTKDQFDLMLLNLHKTHHPLRIEALLEELGPFEFSETETPGVLDQLSLLVDKALPVDPSPGSTGYPAVIERFSQEVGRVETMMVNRDHIEAAVKAYNLVKELTGYPPSPHLVHCRPLVATAHEGAHTGIGVGDILGTQFCGDGCATFSWSGVRYCIVGDKSENLRGSMLKAIDAREGSNLTLDLEGFEVIFPGGKSDFNNQGYEDSRITGLRELLEETGIVKGSTLVNQNGFDLIKGADTFSLGVMPNVDPRTSRNQAWVTTQMIVSFEEQMMKEAVLKVVNDPDAWGKLKALSNMDTEVGSKKPQDLLITDDLRERIRAENWAGVDANEVLAVLGFFGDDDLNCIAAVPIGSAHFKGEHRILAKNLGLSEEECQQMARIEDDDQQFVSGKQNMLAHYQT